MRSKANGATAVDCFISGKPSVGALTYTCLSVGEAVLKTQTAKSANQGVVTAWIFNVLTATGVTGVVVGASLNETHQDWDPRDLEPKAILLCLPPWTSQVPHQTPRLEIQHLSISLHLQTRNWHTTLPVSLLLWKNSLFPILFRHPLCFNRISAIYPLVLSSDRPWSRYLHPVPVFMGLPPWHVQWRPARS